MRLLYSVVLRITVINPSIPANHHPDIPVTDPEVAPPEGCIAFSPLWLASDQLLAALGRSAHGSDAEEDTQGAPTSGRGKDAPARKHRVGSCSTSDFSSGSERHKPRRRLGPLEPG